LQSVAAMKRSIDVDALVLALVGFAPSASAISTRRPVQFACRAATRIPVAVPTTTARALIPRPALALARSEYVRGEESLMGLMQTRPKPMLDFARRFARRLMREGPQTVQLGFIGSDKNFAPRTAFRGFREAKS